MQLKGYRLRTRGPASNELHTEKRDAVLKITVGTANLVKALILCQGSQEPTKPKKGTSVREAVVLWQNAVFYGSLSELLDQLGSRRSVEHEVAEDAESAVESLDELSLADDVLLHEVLQQGL